MNNIVFQYIEHFKSSPTWATMAKTVEDSPWHREDSVAVHTEMVMDQYVQRFLPIRSWNQNKIALIALLFHDTGKPTAEEVVEKKDGSGEVYRRYAGHEQDSAIAFTNAWLTDSELRTFINGHEARKIRWIIEHHLPYGFKNRDKRQALRDAMAVTMEGDITTFYDCLRSDCAGRISDNHPEKLANVEEWIKDFDTMPVSAPQKIDEWRGTCYILIGPSGSGKSTWMAPRLTAASQVISRDHCYMSYYPFATGAVVGEDVKKFYDEAWHYCCITHQADYEAYYREHIANKFKYAKVAHTDVYVDNTNGGKKARARFVQEARNIGMRVVAIEFWNTFETLVARQAGRPEKHVPASSIKQQFFAQTCAWHGSEVDEAIVISPQT